MTTKAERSARISALWTALRNERLASIRDDLADIGCPNASTITAHYSLSEEYGWPVLTRLDIDETQTIDLLDELTPVSVRFSGTNIQDTLNGLLIEDYDPDEGDASLTFSFLEVTEGVAL